MSIFKEIPPTAGFPLSPKDFLLLFKKEINKNCLQDDFKGYLGTSYAQITYSGTAAFYLILESVKELSPKRTIIIPAYVCPLLALAIQRAGLKIQVCDINKYDFNFNLGELEELCRENKDILAIVTVHLAGLPIDIDSIQEIAARYKIFTIEDCAQALGAVYKNKKVGTLGDFAFFSLCRGKGLTIYEGGVIVVNRKEYAGNIDDKMRLLVKNNFFSEGLKILEMLAYAIFYRPQLFWFVFRLPQIFWNLQGDYIKAYGEYFTTDFPIHNVSSLRKRIGHLNFYRLEKEIDKQRQKAEFYLDRLNALGGIKFIKEIEGTRAIYPYLVLVFDDPQKKKKALKLFAKSALGVSLIYVSVITDYAYLKDIVSYKDCPNARYLSDRAITLSTSTFLKEKDINAVLDIIRGL